MFNVFFYLKTNGFAMDHLQEAKLKVFSEEECMEFYEDDFTSDQICSADLERGKGECNGDSGGPLLYVEDDLAKVFQIGVVSWGIEPCGNNDHPGVYTKVSHYIDWIKLKTKRN